MKLVGYIMRKQGLEKLTLTGSIECKIDRSREYTSQLPFIDEWQNRVGDSKKTNVVKVQ